MQPVKSLEELKKIRETAKEKLKVREIGEEGIRINENTKNM